MAQLYSYTCPVCGAEKSWKGVGFILRPEECSLKILAWDDLAAATLESYQACGCEDRQPLVAESMTSGEVCGAARNDKAVRESSDSARALLHSHDGNKDIQQLIDAFSNILQQELLVAQANGERPRFDA